MSPGLITMSQKEISHLEIIQRVVSKQLTQILAAEQLNLTTRQIRNLKQRYLQHGPSGLISKRRGKPSNHRISEKLKSTVIELIKQHYADFGPTLACEKLLECHSIKLSKESIRQLMMQAGLWHGKKRKPLKVYSQRQRRGALGELVQIDGSYHPWFEERADSCCLLVVIDDATSRLLALRFEPVETTLGYFRLFKTYLKIHGRPLACYHDKHSIFQINARDVVAGDSITQFGRAMNELGIESISANTPQAKGRVERANQTLQDRLVKELRLKGINDIESANAFLPGFIENFNQKFAVAPKEKQNAHQTTLPEDSILDLILTEQSTRKISKNLEVNYQHKVYQINIKTQGYAMRGAGVKVCDDGINPITLLYKGKPLNYNIHEKVKKCSQIAHTKDVNKIIDLIKIDKRTKGNKPAAHHPWRNSYKSCRQPTQQAAIL